MKPTSMGYIIINMDTGWISKFYENKRDAVRDAAYYEVGELTPDVPELN